MNILNWVFWGLAATFAQMLFESLSIGFRLTRMTLIFMLGTMWTSERSKGKVIGFFHHIVNGMVFTFVYIAAFHFLHRQTWWIGGLLGFAQAAFVLTVGMSLLPSIHPRMANEHEGPTAMRQLEPPGFLASNYGPGTPVSIFVSHIIFGIVIGSFCHI